MKPDFNITEFCNPSYSSNLDSLTQLKYNFRKLDQLNQILAKSLPEHLGNTCHVGAIDIVKSIVVIFVSNQQSFHLLRNLNNHILQAFSRENFSFDKILMKVGQYKNNNKKDSFELKNIDGERKEKLAQLALLINKPELIMTQAKTDNNIDDDDELRF